MVTLETERAQIALLDKLKKIHKFHVRYHWAITLIGSCVVLTIMLGGGKLIEIVIAMVVETGLSKLRELAIFFEE